jgi:hypothetical protein
MLEKLEVARGWQTPSAIATCLAIVQSLVLFIIGHQQNLKKNLDELKLKALTTTTTNLKLEGRALRLQSST